jgi:hypothetical protein
LTFPGTKQKYFSVVSSRREGIARIADVSAYKIRSAAAAGFYFFYVFSFSLRPSVVLILDPLVNTRSEYFIINFKTPHHITAFLAYHCDKYGLHLFQPA